MDCFNIDGQVALITDGGTGLGKQFAHALSQAGATVVLAARRREKLEETAKEINNQGGNAHTVSIDVTDAASISSAYTQIAELGTPTILVNNAGAAQGGALLEIEQSSWQQIQDTNVMGVWLVAKENAKRLIAENKTGSIINIASILSVVSQKAALR